MTIPVLSISSDVLPKLQSIHPSTNTGTSIGTLSKKNALTLVDFESTLWDEDPRFVREHGFVVPERVVQVLRGLVAQRWNKVWLLSGLPVKTLEKIADAVPGLGLV